LYSSCRLCASQMYTMRSALPDVTCGAKPGLGLGHLDVNSFGAVGYVLPSCDAPWCHRGTSRTSAGSSRSCAGAR
jgi:hypothetical protein